MPVRPFQFLKRFLPKNLFGRFIIILLVPLILVQLVLSYIFFDRHTDTVLRLLSHTIGGDIALVSHMVEEGKSFDAIARQASAHLSLDIVFKKAAHLKEIGQAKDTWLYDHLNHALLEQLKHPYFFRMDKDTIYVDVQLKQGVLKVKTLRKRLFSKTTYLVLIWTTASALLLFIVAVIFMRNQIKPIRKLADAAERFGKGHEIIGFKPEGALEVRKAAIAFNQMRHRILRFIEERTQQLAGVSHDLRTPLTRMKLQLTLMPPSEATKDLQKDVEEMTQMVQGFLDFARGAMEEPSVEVDFLTFIEDIIHHFKKSHPLSLTLSGKKSVKIHIKRQLLNRCLTNLLLNSFKYASTAHVSTAVFPTSVEILVDDDGPGIPLEKRNVAFQPFTRLDPSRNSETGGVGLGLTIVRDAIRHHGGHVDLDTSPLGGLRVRLVIPR
ncbi:MAG: HAMP domain-containing protein [Alphaproteobacteria bacterium]|nr:HAMP domain-containing protein [Alphaproteobacteria bacterium]